MFASTPMNGNLFVDLTKFEMMFSNRDIFTTNIFLLVANLQKKTIIYFFFL